MRAAGEASGERVWPLPLWDEYDAQIKSPIADIKNTGGRPAGACTAAMFLKEFVDQTPWIHLDIAGTAWVDENKAWIAKGPSGIAVRSIVEFVRDLAGDGSGGSRSGRGGGSKGTEEAQKRADSGAGL
jgi:leucyl aminopeptidase